MISLASLGSQTKKGLVTFMKGSRCALVPIVISFVLAMTTWKVYILTTSKDDVTIIHIVYRPSMRCCAHYAGDVTIIHYIVYSMLIGPIYCIQDLYFVSSDVIQPSQAWVISHPLTQNSSPIFCIQDLLAYYIHIMIN